MIDDKRLEQLIFDVAEIKGTMTAMATQIIAIAKARPDKQSMKPLITLIICANTITTAWLTIISSALLKLITR